MRGSPLARLVLAVYALLVVYASLYPLSGWREHGLSPLEFLLQPWPRHVLAFDVAADFVGYAVLGLLAVLAWQPRLRGGNAVLGALAVGTALSIALEAAQTYLPSRVPSNVDVLCNAAGALAGALAGLALAPMTPALGGWRARLFLPGALSDIGLALLGLWLFMQLNRRCCCSAAATCGTFSPAPPARRARRSSSPPSRRPRRPPTSQPWHCSLR